jgi:adenine-specific DNA-methyltransferase
MSDEQKKEKGSYYTPQLLADFMVYHLFDKRNFLFSKEVSILEPSAGDGIFFKSILSKQNFTGRSEFKLPNKINILAIERENEELAKVESYATPLRTSKRKIEFLNCDYLDFQLNNTKKFDLIIGNPPYIKSNHLTDDQIKSCLEIHKRAGLSDKKIKNIWTSFLIGAVQSISDNGALAFVLPAELLQVIYAKEIRDLLKENFEFGKIDIFSFNELIFKDIEQDVIVLICAKNQKNPGVSFYHVDKLEDLKTPDYTKDNSNVHRTTLDKWTNYILSDSDLKFLDRFKAKHSLRPIRYYTDSVAGIVTAANDYFIADQATIDRYGFEKHVKPIIKKSSHLPSSLILDDEDLKKMNDSGMPCWLIDLENKPSDSFPEKHKEYLNIGIGRNLHNRYKMKLRENWYSIPSVWGSEGFFTKRSNIYPRIIINQAEALVTDSFYRIKMRDNFRMQDLAFSFYNTLTFIYAELEGRYYGGSVLELTPNEFKDLTIPYVSEVKKSDIKKLERIMRSKSKPGALLEYTDKVILIDHYGMTKREVERLRNIYIELVKRRLKNKSEDFMY